jgi:small-conductance mechanosensitive channel
MVVAMFTRSINRSGTLLIIAGILIAVPMLFHPDDSQPGFALHAAWVPVHVLMGIGTIAAFAGLLGFYGALRSRLTGFGVWSFGLALFGTALFTGLLFFVEITLFPVLGRDPVYQSLLNETGPLMGGPFGMAVLLFAVIASLGYVFLAIDLAVNRTISIVNAVLFIGVPIAAFAPPLPFMLERIGGVLFGIALTWLGVSIRRGVAHRALERELRRYDECLTPAGGHA